MMRGKETMEWMMMEDWRMEGYWKIVWRLRLQERHKELGNVSEDMYSEGMSSCDRARGRLARSGTRKTNESKL